MHGPLSKGFLPFFPSASALKNKPASAKNRDRTATQFLTLLLRPKIMMEKIAMHSQLWDTNSVYKWKNVSREYICATHSLPYASNTTEIVADDMFCLSNSITQHGTSKISHQTVNRKTFIIRHV